MRSHRKEPEITASVSRAGNLVVVLAIGEASRRRSFKDVIKLTRLVSRSGVPTFCYVNYTLYENCSAVGEVRVGNCGHGGKCYDEDVIPLLAADVGQYSSGFASPRSSMVLDLLSIHSPGFDRSGSFLKKDIASTPTR